MAAKINIISDENELTNSNKTLVTPYSSLYSILIMSIINIFYDIYNFLIEFDYTEKIIFLWNMYNEFIDSIILLTIDDYQNKILLNIFSFIILLFCIFCIYKINKSRCI